MSTHKHSTGCGTCPTIEQTRNIGSRRATTDVVTVASVASTKKCATMIRRRPGVLLGQLAQLFTSRGLLSVFTSPVDGKQAFSIRKDSFFQFSEDVFSNHQQAFYGSFSLAVQLIRTSVLKCIRRLSIFYNALWHQFLLSSVSASAIESDYYGYIDPKYSSAQY